MPAKRPRREKAKSLPQELRTLGKKLFPLWESYEATPKGRVKQRLRLLREILKVRYADTELYETLEALGETPGARGGWGKKDPAEFYFWQSQALEHVLKEVGDVAKRAAKRPETLPIALEAIDLYTEVAGHWNRLVRMVKKREKWDNLGR